MKESDQSLIINLSMLVQKPTGIANYINGILPHFDGIPYTSLVSKQYGDRDYIRNPHFISNKLNPDYGSKGNFSRLAWTQFRLPQIYQQLDANLLFSPVPEMPLFTNCNTIIMVHDLIPLRCPQKGSPLTAYFRFCLPFVCQQATHIICNSEATADDIVDFFDVPATKITSIVLGYDQTRFRPITDIPQKQSKPYFVHLGRHNHHKNVSRIISAFAHFQYCQDYELWFVGPTDSRYTPDLQEQAQELAISSQVKFLDYVADHDLPVILSQAHALIFPSLWEGFGFPVLEAIACGTPVITSNLSSLPEVAGDAALYVNPYQVKDIVEAMNQISKDDLLRQQLIERGLARAKEFNWQKTAQETMRVIEQFL